MRWLKQLTNRPDWVGEVAEMIIAIVLCAIVVLVLVACFSAYP